MSTKPTGRVKLLAAFEAATRDASGQGVLYSQAVADRLGLNPTDLECLGLVMRGPVTAGALAQASGLTTGAITGVIDRLERAGYARRGRDPADRRKVIVSATPRAARRVEPLFAPMRDAMAVAMKGYTDSQLALLIDFQTRANAAATAALVALRGPVTP